MTPEATLEPAPEVPLTPSATCPACGKAYFIGAWPFCPHEVVSEYHPFIPYVDEHVSGSPVEVTSLAQRWRLMRQNHMDYRGKKVGEPGCMV